MWTIGCSSLQSWQAHLSTSSAKNIAALHELAAPPMLYLGSCNLLRLVDANLCQYPSASAAGKADQN